MLLRFLGLFILLLSFQSLATAEQKTESVVLAGGCFWCIEADFEKLDGVVDVDEVFGVQALGGAAPGSAFSGSRRSSTSA